MTVQQAIERANDLRAGNAVPDENKIEYLNELEQGIYNDIILQHKYKPGSRFLDDDGNIISCPNYSDGNTGATLLVESPYDMLYVYWLTAKIDLFSREFNNYNTSMTLYLDVYTKYASKMQRENESIDTPEIKVGVF
jgi:hypothetical protein